MLVGLRKINKHIPIQLFLLWLLPICVISLRTNHLNCQNRDCMIVEMQECQCDFCKEVEATTALQTRKVISIKQPEKDWTFIVYMAADNDLRSFAARNIKQMASIGSNEHINILVHLDIRVSGNKKITRRYFIEKNRILHVNSHDQATQCMNSGDPNTLISCCKWGIKDYPAKEYALIFWNHGTGIIDPPHGRIINPAELFSFNPSTNRLELDRSIGFLDLINCLEPEQRGICWDDSIGNYLTNQKLESALATITKDYLKGNKLSIIGFDACLMSMIEIGNIVKNYAHIMVSSQEVELGMGWNYSAILYPFAKNSLDMNTFAQNIVDMYAKTYNSITNDYTLSAINLNSIESLEQNVDRVAQLLIEALNKQKNRTVKNALKASRNKLLCTHFDEPTYVDLHHLYSNLLNNLGYFRFDDAKAGATITAALERKLSQGKELIDNIVIANTTGRNLKNAHGISIYFPERGMYTSYKDISFVEQNAWGAFLYKYLMN